MTRYRVRPITVLPVPPDGRPLFLRVVPGDEALVDGLVAQAGETRILLEQLQQARDTAAHLQRQLRLLDVRVELPWAREA